MKNWLDKYDDGGTMQEHQENYNDYSVSAPEGMQGDGYSNVGRDYSPAWGGQFQMGGSLPGAVGFTYARTQGSAPANGKYTKKTKASAQKGKSLFKAPDVPLYAQGRESTAIEQPAIPLSDVDISRNKFRNEALRAKSKSPNITLSDWLTPGKLIAKQELSDLGENLDPFQYGSKEGSPIERIFRSGILGSKEKGRKDLEAAAKNKPSDIDPSYIDEGKTRADLLQLYARRPQQYNTLEPADYIPTSGHQRGDEYVKSKFVENALMSSILNQSDTTQPIPSLRTKEDIQRYIETHGETALDTKPGAKTRGIATKVPALGTATLSAGEENGRPYLSYYDLWDLNPYVGAYSDTPEGKQKDWHNQLRKEGVDIATKFAGAKPPKVYGRIYFDPETGRPIQKEDGGEIPHAQNGQEMSYYQHGLDFKTKGMEQGGKTCPKGFVNIDGKCIETDSDKYKDMLDKGQVGTMKDDVYYSSKSELQPVTIFSTKDKGTQEFYDKFKNKSPENYNALIKLGQEYGFPKVSLKDAKKNLDITDVNLYDRSDKGEYRSNYDFFNDKIYLDKNKDTSDLLDEYIAELSHHVQAKNKGGLNVGLRELNTIGRTLKNSLVNFESPTKAYDKEYDLTGSIENEAHSEIEPKLKEKFDKHHLTESRISDYYKYPGTFYTDKPNTKYKEGGVVKDDMGYWNPDNYGKVVEIDSPYITMEGVDEPLIGISDEGDQQYMTPGKNYKFKGKRVREYPVAKNGLRQEQKGLQNLDQLTNFTNYNKPQPGGWLDKY